MTTPTPDDKAAEGETDQEQPPSVGPAYSTPPPEGLPDADSG